MTFLTEKAVFIYPPKEEEVLGKKKVGDFDFIITYTKGGPGLVKAGVVNQIN